MVATQIRLDLNGKKGPDLWARLGESDTRQIVMHPGYYDPEGNWVPLVIDSENINAKFRIVKPDNTFVIQDASLYLPSDPSIFVVTLPAAATQVAGLGYYDLRIGDHESTDTFLYSAGGRFIIDDDMITDEMIESVAAVNGMIFPDDFLTTADLADYVTNEELTEMDLADKQYVNDAIAAIPDPLDIYSIEERIIGKWVDGSDLYQRTIIYTNAINNGANAVIYEDSSYNFIGIDPKGSSLIRTNGQTWSLFSSYTYGILIYQEVNANKSITLYNNAGVNFSSGTITIIYTKS